MTADPLWKSIFYRFTAMLNSVATFLRRPDTAHQVKTASVAPAPSDTESTKLEILQLVHDLRNQLTILQLSADDIPDSPNERAHRLGELQQSVGRAVLLINALLLDGQARLPGRRSVDANEVVRRTAATLSHIMSDLMDVQLGLWPEPLTVIADVDELDRVLLNLALNAFDAMPDGGVLTIKTAIAHISGLGHGRLPGPYVRLTVKDTGCGMTAEVKDRIFDPFFTTKRGGTGLGLHSVAVTVQQLQGHISVDSEPGRGTSVSVLLPLAPEAYVLNFSAPDAPPDSRD